MRFAAALAQFNGGGRLCDGRRSGAQGDATMILLIDDDEPFRTGLAANLREDGCEVLEVASGPSVPVDQLPAIDLVVTDYPMDREDELAFARRFHRTFPTVPVIILTAFATAHLESEIAGCEFFDPATQTGGLRAVTGPDRAAARTPPNRVQRLLAVRLLRCSAE